MSRQKAPEGETPEQRFIRVAGLRVSNLVQGLEILGSQGGEVPNREYSDQAFAAIQGAVDKARVMWNEKQSAAKRRSFEFQASQATLPHTATTPTKNVSAAKR